MKFSFFLLTTLFFLFTACTKRGSQEQNLSAVEYDASNPDLVAISVGNRPENLASILYVVTDNDAMNDVFLALEKLDWRATDKEVMNVLKMFPVSKFVTWNKDELSEQDETVVVFEKSKVDNIFCVYMACPKTVKEKPQNYKMPLHYAMLKEKDFLGTSKIRLIDTPNGSLHLER